MRNLFFLLVAGLAFNASLAQNATRTKISAVKKAVVVPSQIKADWAPTIQHMEMPVPGSQSERGRLLQLKEERKAARQLKSSGSSKTLQTSGQQPQVLRNFEGNTYNFRVPNDNDMAVSNSGKIVSVINSTIFAFDGISSTPSGAWSLAAFADTLGITESMFDPKVEYDPVNDRFVMIWLAGFLDSTSNIIVAFSQTGDPMLGWNLYALPGNPLNNNTWSDFPVTGLSEFELFIGMNTFTNGSSNNSGFTESCLWQVSLRDGYNGDTLNTSYFSNILQQGRPIFNICPVIGGSLPTGPDMFLLSNRNVDATGDTLFLLHIGDTINGPNHGIAVNTLILPENYVIPPTARQPLNHTFDTNDSRILGAFYENNKIQFVQSCEDTTTGFAAVYHGIIEDPLGAQWMTVNVYGDTLMDLGYPNIVYAGLDSLDDAAIITVNHTAPSVYAGCSAFNYHGNGQYSGLTQIKEGLKYVHVLSGYYERWGDYSGAQRKYNEPGVSWMAGYYGTYSNKNGTWIAELSRFGPTPNVKETSEVAGPAKVYPNPVIDFFNMEFEAPVTGVYSFEILDMNGRIVKYLMNEKVKKGKNQFSFSTGPLAPGIYFLKVESGDFSLSKKLVKK